MDIPKNTAQPFFAYGIFRPGQIGFLQLKELVFEVMEPSYIDGTLLLRDGLPIIDPCKCGRTKGVIIWFITDSTVEAYNRISKLEPDEHYLWGTALSEDISVNVLFGRHPRNRSVFCEDKEWNCWDDPLFTSALRCNWRNSSCNSEFDFSLKPLFRLQMAYLLLWSSIERYVSLRYHFGGKVKPKVDQLQNEPAFADSLKIYVRQDRIGDKVYRADRPNQKEVLAPESPGKDIDYYHQIRSNIIHRGKAAIKDHNRILHSRDELTHIFKRVLEATRSDAMP